MQYKGFTKQARKAMRLAENLAEKEQQTQMGSEYLLAGLLLEGHGVAYEILQQLSVNCEDILALIHEIALPNEEEFPAQEDFLTPEGMRLLTVLMRQQSGLTVKKSVRNICCFL